MIIHINNSNLSAKEAQSLIRQNRNNPNFIILDVRTPQEFKSGHIENAINIDFYAKDFREKLSEPDRENIYLIYCRSGYRSGTTLKILKELKFRKLYNLEGGIIAWHKNNYPIIK